jgi:hypothetical protein
MAASNFSMTTSGTCIAGYVTSLNHIYLNEMD